MAVRQMVHPNIVQHLNRVLTGNAYTDLRAWYSPNISFAANVLTFPPSIPSRDGVTVKRFEANYPNNASATLYTVPDGKVLHLIWQGVSVIAAVQCYHYINAGANPDLTLFNTSTAGWYDNAFLAPVDVYAGESIIVYGANGVSATYNILGWEEDCPSPAVTHSDHT